MRASASRISRGRSAAGYGAFTGRWRRGRDLLEDGWQRVCRGRGIGDRSWRPGRFAAARGGRPKQLLPMAVEVLLHGIRGGTAVGDLLAEPSHRAVGVIERQLFSAGNAEAM